MTNYMKFDVICKYDRFKETYYGGVPSLGIELKDKYSQGELLEDAIQAVDELFNGIARRPNGDYIEFESSLAAIKLEINMRVTKDQRLDEYFATQANDDDSSTSDEEVHQ